MQEDDQEDVAHAAVLLHAQIAASKTSNVVVMYASAYGNTAALAQAISRGVVKSGVAVNTVNLEVTPLDDVVAAVKASDGFTIGSPTLGGHMPTPVQVRMRQHHSKNGCGNCALLCLQSLVCTDVGLCPYLINSSILSAVQVVAAAAAVAAVYADCCAVLCCLFALQLALGSILRSGGARELPCGVFGSFGWSGEAVDEMEAKLEDGGYGFAFQPIKVKFKPTTKVTTAACPSAWTWSAPAHRHLNVPSTG